MAKCLLDELMNGLIAAAEVKKLGPSKNENMGRKLGQGLQSTKVKSMFDLSYI